MHHNSRVSGHVSLLKIDRKKLYMMTIAALLKYEVHYSSEILFLEPVPVKTINEQKSFLPEALHHGIPFSRWETVNI